MADAKGEKKLTGKHVLLWLFAFFGAMLIANGFFVYYANVSWPGVEVESPYKESQNYNNKLQEAAEQEKRDWHIAAELKRRQNDVFLVVDARDKLKNPLRGLKISANLGRPATEKFDKNVELTEMGEGLYQVNIGQLDPGPWRVKIEASEKDQEKFHSVGHITLK